MRKRLVSLLLSAAMAATMLLTGCNAAGGQKDSTSAAPETKAEAENTEAAESEETEGEAEVSVDPSEWPVVTVQAAALGVMESEQSIEDHLNDYLVSINAGVQCDIVQIDFGNMSEVLTLMLADTQNPLDLFCWRWYSTVDGLVKNDQVISLEPYKDVYPELWEMFADPIHETQRVNGVQYALPAADSFGTFEMYMIHRDIAEEIGVADRDGEKITFDEMCDIMRMAKEAHPELCFQINTVNEVVLGIDSFNNSDWIGVLLNRGVGEETIVNLYETQEFLDYALQCREWFEEGMLVPDPLVNPTDFSQYSNGVGAGVFVGGYSQDYIRDLTSDQPDSCYYQLTDLVGNTASVLGGWCISSVCAHPDAAMKLLDLMYIDPVVARYFILGVEGEDYVVDDQGIARFAPGKDATNAGWNQTCQWFWPNQNISIPFEKSNPDFYVDMAEAPKHNTYSTAMGFTFDTEPVFDQMAACSSVVKEYKLSLLYGQFDDVQGAIDELNKELKAAGIDDVLTEMQAQYDKFLGK